MDATLSTEDVIGLERVTANDLALAGGKAVNLGELVRAGLPVPAGFVITTEAYAAAAAAVGLPEQVIEATPAALRQLLESAPITDTLRRQVTEAYRRLGDDLPVAVRSSATAEDLPGAAFAGQQDTYLNVIGIDAVLDAVRRCWASLWTERAVSYRAERRIDPEGVRLAIVVQVLVDADAAGVMFTADPVTGRRDRVLIDAAPGLGEAVVSGLVTPDHFDVASDGTIDAWHPGSAGVVIRPDAAGGVRQDAAVDGNTPVISEHQVAELVAYARTAAAHFGRPQDVEWAVAADRVWILQARPMTAVPPEPVTLNRRQRIQSTVFSEYLPVRPYPLDVTTWIARGPAELMRQLTRYYGVRGAFSDYLQEEDGVVVGFVPPSPYPGAGILRAPFEIARKARRFHPEQWQSDPRLAQLLAEADSLDALQLNDLSWEQLLRVPDRALGVVDISRDLRIDYLPGALVAIMRLAVVVTLLGRRRLLPDLTGGAPTRTTASEQALIALAQLAREDERLFLFVQDQSATDVLDVLSHGQFPRFAEALTQFRHDFGRKETTSPLLVSPPTLAESPEVIIGMVRGLLSHPPSTDRQPPSRRALKRLLGHPLLRTRWAHHRIKKLVRNAQAGVAYREDSHFYFTATLPALRRSLLEIGARLTEVGVLDEAFDVFHLRWSEIAAIEDVTALPPEEAARLRALVTTRAARRAELAGIPLVDVRDVFHRRDDSDALVTGAPAGNGTARGTVRIIRGAEDFHRLQRGDVLVCPYTNPAWTPLFLRAAAVVVDTGSLASHAAIVAREYGLPAIMGTGDGTSVLRDGEPVTVDGTRGRVTRG